ncbi:MAG: hypothetical protein ACHQC8_04350 [Solirubrobacterales bacterium]
MATPMLEELVYSAAQRALDLIPGTQRQPPDGPPNPDIEAVQYVTAG